MAGPLPRRALIAIPFGLAGLLPLVYRRERALPNPAQSGTGPEVVVVLFSDSGITLGTARLRKIVKTDREWHRDLTFEQFSIARHGGTEFAYTNAYWKTKTPGLYRCICCGTALFRSEDKYDSETGWPSFTAPIAPANIATKPDRSLAVERVEVLCRKCDAHLGHVFDDGPGPTGLRYCLNSAALVFVPRH